jgi:putative ATP-binding cassette transporter
LADKISDVSVGRSIDSQLRYFEQKLPEKLLSPEAYVAPDERRLLIRFWQSASGFWRGRSAWRAWLLIALMISVVLLQLFVQYRLNFWNRDFFNAIGRKDGTELWPQALRFLPIATASVVLAVISVWGRMTTQRTWREWLSDHLYDYWLENGHSHRLRFMLGEHQTPEYRIAEDARVATDLPIISALDCYRRSSARSRLLASSGLLGAIS